MMGILGYWGAHLKTSESIAHTCRRELLNSQQTAGNMLQKLLALNPLAKALRAEKQLALAAMAAAAASVNPGAFQAALQWYQNVIRQQLSLDKVQRGLVTSANLAISRGSVVARAKVLKKVKTLENKWEHFLKVEVRSVKSTAGILAVHPDVLAELAPAYELNREFHRQQSSQLIWKKQMSVLPTQWLSHWTHLKFTQIEFCAASIEQREHKWVAKPIRDKPLSSL